MDRNKQQTINAHNPLLFFIFIPLLLVSFERLKKNLDSLVGQPGWVGREREGVVGARQGLLKACVELTDSVK
jgi:hypothetical protein